MAGFAYYVIQRNDTTNDNSFFFMSDGDQGNYSKMLNVACKCAWKSNFTEFKNINQ